FALGLAARFGLVPAPAPGLVVLVLLALAIVSYALAWWRALYVVVAPLAFLVAVIAFVPPAVGSPGVATIALAALAAVALGAAVMRSYAPASAELAVVAMFFAVLMGIPLGIMSATHRDKPVDHVGRLVALSGVSVPVFWLALILQLVFAFYLGQRGFDFFPL